jgi:hypothetical protein
VLCVVHRRTCTGGRAQVVHRTTCSRRLRRLRDLRQNPPTSKSPGLLPLRPSVPPLANSTPPRRGSPAFVGRRPSRQSQCVDTLHKQSLLKSSKRDITAQAVAGPTSQEAHCSEIGWCPRRFNHYQRTPARPAVARARTSN